MTPHAAFEVLNRAAGIAPLAAPKFEGAHHENRLQPFSAPFRFPTAAAAALGFAAAAAAEIWRFRGGDRQSISVDLKSAAVSLAAHTIVRLNGSLLPEPKDGTATTGFYQTNDRRWLYLRGGFPHLARRTLDLLNARDEPPAVTAAVAKWNGVALENALAFMGLTGSLVRSREEWQMLAVPPQPPIVLRKIGDAPPFRPAAHAMPLGDLRVLDLTRLTAGAAATATLASHGAQVLRVVSPRLPDPAEYAFGAGKRVTELDLKKPGDAEILRHLVREAQVFVDAYRPGALAGLGFSPASLAHIAPGLITVSLSAYYGPWAPQRGFEDVVQAATGMAAEQGSFLAAQRGKPREILPALVSAPVLSVLTGYLAAAGVAAALLRRIREGGSWHVDVSLAATAAWLLTLGRIDAVADALAPRDGLDPYLYSCETRDGWFELLGPVVRLDKTPPVKGALPDGFVSPHWASVHEEANAAEKQPAQT